MQLSKFEHSCVQVSNGESTVVIDPGVYSSVEQACQGVDAILITHEHPDHLDQERVLPILEASPELQLYAPASVVQQLRNKPSSTLSEAAAARVHAVSGGECFDIQGLDIQCFGFQHALIHPLIPLVSNVGYLIAGTVFHPGDSYTVPAAVQVDTLLFPLHAPWAKVGEIADYLIAINPRTALPIHNALLNDNGEALVSTVLKNVTSDYGPEIDMWGTGEQRTVKA